MARPRSGWVLLAVPVIVAAAVVWWRWPSGSEIETLDVVSDAPRFDTVEELVAASEAVVLATVVDTSAGRTVTDPTDPEVGILTGLAELEIEQVLTGSLDGGSLVVEHERALLDGTPIRVDGVAAPEVGERAVWFLLSGDSTTQPYWVVIGPQGRIPVVGGRLTAPTDDPLLGEVAGTPVDELGTVLADAQK